MTFSTHPQAIHKYRTQTNKAPSLAVTKQIKCASVNCSKANRKQSIGQFMQDGKIISTICKTCRCGRAK